jgi:thioredoxin reductase
MSYPDEYDVIIIGGGPAGLSAALVLGRCRRRVLICDEGHPRNASSIKVNSFFTRDNTPPHELLRLAREQLKPYSSVQYIRTRVKDACRTDTGFEVVLQDKVKARSRKLLLATGLVDDFPEVEGFKDLYGKSIFHCPYCDGWEVQDKRLGIYGESSRAFHMARGLTAWSNDLIIFTDGPSRLSHKHLLALERNKIPVIEEKVSMFKGKDGILDSVVLTNGAHIPRDAIFFDRPSYQTSELPRKLRCEFNKHGGIATKKYETTNLPGLFAAGNITRDVQLVVVAAAEGAKAAFGINLALTSEDFR